MGYKIDMAGDLQNAHRNIFDEFHDQPFDYGSERSNGIIHYKKDKICTLGIRNPVVLYKIGYDLSGQYNCRDRKSGLIIHSYYSSPAA